MSKEAQFYRQQANQQRESAAEASLANVRERCERAAAAWEVMADRSERTLLLRAGRGPDTIAAADSDTD